MKTGKTFNTEFHTFLKIGCHHQNLYLKKKLKALILNVWFHFHFSNTFEVGRNSDLLRYFQDLQRLRELNDRMKLVEPP